MNSLSFSFSELNQFLLKHIYSGYKTFIDILLMVLFLFNLLLLIGLVIYLEIAVVLFLLQQFDLLDSIDKVLNHKTTFITIFIISMVLLVLSLYHIRSSQQSLLDWINSHRIRNLFTSPVKQKNSKIVKDDQYWGKFYYQRAEKFRYGQGVEKNIQYALKLYHAAAKLNHTKAQISLSYLLLVKNNQKQSNTYSEAFSWALKASQYNEPEAWFNLGHMYKNGLGTGKNIPKAINAFEQAIYNGFYHIEKSGAAYYELGLLYLDSTTMEPNYSKSINWLTKAVASDYSGANTALKKAFVLNKKNRASNQTKNNQHNNQEKKEKFKDKIFKLSCPCCDSDLLIPNPIPKGNSICSKCYAKFNLKLDSHGNLQIYAPPSKVFKIEEKLPQSEKDARNILSVITLASKTRIKQAYKIKMLEYHPDRVNNLGSKLKSLAEHESKRINAAYKLLKRTA